MTNQEAINVLEKYTDVTMSKSVIEAHNMAIDALKKTQWIPCSEMLPEPGTKVLAFIKHNYMEDGWREYRTYEYTDHFVGMGNLCEVVAWMPLPEPYKGE